ncbi:hypothetical protein ACB092_12G124000 [Castanea dentata]
MEAAYFTLGMTISPCLTRPDNPRFAPCVRFAPCGFSSLRKGGEAGMGRDFRPAPWGKVGMEERKYKSIVWNHFKRKRVDEKDKAECNYCKKLLVRESNYGTKHLHDHVKICPRRKLQDVRDMNQKNLARDQNKVDSMAGVNAYNFDQNVSRNELARMIILHEYPLSIVDHIGFRNNSTSLRPLFRMVSRNTIKDILSIYVKEMEKSKHEIDKNQGRISITTDMWTSHKKKRGFMVVTAHFIDEFIYMPSPYTKEVFFSVILDNLLEWNIDRKLSTMTMDNCSTNSLVIKIILDKLQCGVLIMRGSMLHMRCAAHVRNLIVQDGLDVIGSCIEKVRKNVRFWTASTKRRQKFKETARQAHVECTKELALDCWQCFTRLQSYSQVPHTLQLIFSFLSDVIRSMTFKMLEKFDCYWNVIHGVMAVTTILDPRYKIELLEYYFPIIYDDETDNEIQRYPTLQRIARDILAILVSTIASESSFSTSGRLLSPHRSKLHRKAVEALVCAQNWLWAEINGN